MRGERGRRNPTRNGHIGSSPHARGTRWQSHSRWYECRFIPACAGNAAATRPPIWCMSVHPRMRGERDLLCFSLKGRGGSSPHARGTPRDRRLHLRVNRFIPACAGNAFCAEVVHRLRPVHPRMRGERQTVIDEIMSYCGSSPHARGTLTPTEENQLRERFIPACAGNAGGCSSAEPESSVHPRMRGERSTFATSVST